MKTVTLGRSDLHVTPICLGTMTFGEQVDEPTAHQILARSLERGVDFMDTAEMYAVPTRAETYGATETIIGNYFARNPGVRQRWTLASKVAGPSRGMAWLRGGSDNLTAADIVSACEASLRRLQTDVIDLYQIHWPVRHVPAFGNPYFDPAKVRNDLAGTREQLEGLAQLVKAGKVREIGLSNETPYGVMEFTRVAAEHGLPGEHHFYITFRPHHPDVAMSDHLKARHPDEMTIVLQHQFWDLDVGEDGFSVTLSFSGKPEKMVIPFSAVTGFADPSAKFGLQFQAIPGDDDDDDMEIDEFDPQPHPTSADSGDKPEPPPAGGDGNVVALDKFRKK